ncbi:MAG: murein biosynthesis integral membrane protein MurJ [Azoarcus sp.]|jgi:putative peptidoglycan lipid II flippase|nr:murein biosynthesis integral membrane protein MurJ [Azoarcus sp.]
MNLLRALATVSGLTFLSRILGFLRDFICARLFGAGAMMDAFFVAFMLPNLLRRLFAEGAFSQAYVPILAEYKNKQGPEATRALVDRVATLLTLAVAVVALLGVVGAPFITDLVASGFRDDPDNPTKFALTVELTRITFPYILFIALVSLAAGILNTWNRFAIPAFTPVMLNLSIIAMSLFAAPYFDPPVKAVAWGAFIGGLLQLGLQIVPLARIGMLPRPKFDPAFPGVRRILALMGPAVVGVSVSQLSLLINTRIASHLTNGSVSWLTFADRLLEVPAGILGAALGTILLPSLSKLHADERPEEFSALLDWGLRLTLLLALPAALGLIMLAVPLIATLFQYGAFRPEDVLPTRNALIGYSVGLTAMILIKVLAPSFYARQDVRTPVKIAIFSLVATQVMNLLFIGGAHPAVASALGALPETAQRWVGAAFFGDLAHAGLALSIGLAACLNAGLLYVGLRRRKVYTPQPGWGRFALQLLAALAAMGAVLWFGAAEAQTWIDRGGLERVLWLAGIVVASAAIYFAVLFATGLRPRDFRRRAVQ